MALPGPLSLGLGLRSAPLRARDKAPCSLAGPARRAPAPAGLAGLGHGDGAQRGRVAAGLRPDPDPARPAVGSHGAGRAQRPAGGGPPERIHGRAGPGLPARRPHGLLGPISLPLEGLLAPLPAWLAERGGQLKLASRVTSAQAQEAGPQGWLLALPGEEPVEARRVVLALPAAQALGVLGPGLGRRLGLAAQAARPRSPIVSIYVWSKAPDPCPGPCRPSAPRVRASRPASTGASASPAATAGAAALWPRPPGSWRARTTRRCWRSWRDSWPVGAAPHQWDRARVIREKSATPVFQSNGPRRLAQRTHAMGLALAGD